MAILFSDSFAGSGVLTGHAPDIAFGSYTWTNTGTAINLSGGAMASSDTRVDYDASAAYGTSGAGLGLSRSVYAAIKFKAATVGGTTSYVGFTITLEIDGQNFNIYVYGNYAGSMQWEASIDGATPAVLSGIAADTEYTAVFYRTPAAMTLEIAALGVSLSSSSFAGLNTSGLTKLSVTLGGGLSITDILLADSVPVPGSTGTAVLTSPSPTVAFTGGPTPSAHATAEFYAPSATLSSDGSPARNIGALTAPQQTLSAFGGATAKSTAPLQNLVITGTFTVAGTAALASPTPILSATGKVSAVASAALTAPAGRAAGYFGSIISVSVSGSPAVAATGTTGALGRAEITAPLFDLSIRATAQNHGSAVLAAPTGRLATTGAAWLVAPGATLTAIGTAVVAVSYEAYALNLKHNPTPGVEPVDELTRYTNYPFDRIVRYKNSYFGMNSTGLYLLEGTTDFATPTPTEVPWSYKTALMDMKSVQLKNVSMAYFGGRMGPAATVSVYVGEASVAPYNYTTPRDATAQNYRQPLGKGLKSRYYAFGASGTGELTLDTLSLDVAVLARKV